MLFFFFFAAYVILNGVWTKENSVWKISSGKKWQFLLKFVTYPSIFFTLKWFRKQVRQIFSGIMKNVKFQPFLPTVNQQTRKIENWTPEWLKIIVYPLQSAAICHKVLIICYTETLRTLTTRVIKSYLVALLIIY